MVRVRLIDRARPVPAKIESRCRVRHERIARSAESRDHRVAGAVREVDEEASAGRIVGRERETEQPALVTAADGGSQIEEIRGQHRAGAHDADPARLLDDKLYGSIRRILDDVERQRES